MVTRRKTSPINQYSPQMDNARRGHQAKVQIRSSVLSAIGPEQASVFDAFAGAGEMYAAVWRGAKSYTGCDQKWQRDGRRMFCGDNRRVLRSLKLAPFNIFDLDAYGSPWEQAIIIADRRPVASGELIAFAITEGSGLSLKMSGLPHAMRQLARLRPGIVGLAGKQNDIIDRAIAGLAKRMRCEVVKRWQAEGKTGAAMRYIGIVLKGVAPNGQAKAEEIRG